LIDAAVDLDPDSAFCDDAGHCLYDRNGVDGGRFEGAGPDIGAREWGAGPCDE
jgi:hypothetical protein